ncbi:a-factor receptor [Recurvomyces mirabilis]|uniref:A-factor receptor n=1 Tax=Recurvomyces mirabilis TaxID=574656 RepID=A0AAE1C052_9PEZI|nr:a-factor receptor [Recurvomyces mirabilis]KAK5151033.1 a-factor receptor [Recurvomyces mirabilis]
MAPIPNLLGLLQRATTTDVTDDMQLPSDAPYPLATALAVLSFLVSITLLSPAYSHYRNKNLGALTLVLWTIVFNLRIFTNALIWPNDNIATWFDGHGLCDVEVSLQAAWTVAAPAALASLLRGLAHAMDTNRVSLGGKTKAQLLRERAIDGMLCLGFPALHMLILYIVQARRYAIFGIMGCVPDISTTYLTVAIYWLPPVLWTILDAYYAVLILTRLIHHHLTFASILANSNMTKNRFLRLYLFCTTLVLFFVPLQLFTLYSNLSQKDFEPFSWERWHGAETWDEILMFPSEGRVLYPVYVWLGGGMFIFVFFGFGRDAVEMYRSGLVAMGAHKVWPSLSREGTPKQSSTGTRSSVSSKARMLFSRKGSAVLKKHYDTDCSQSTTVTTTTDADGVSPNSAVFPKDINNHNIAVDAEKDTGPSATQPSLLKRLTTAFRPRQATSFRNFSLTSWNGKAVKCGISSSWQESRSEAASMEVVVHTEVRQASETAGTMETKAAKGGSHAV